MKNAQRGASILVTGGAGYIGSHFVALLVDHGIDYVVIDDLSRGNPGFVPAGHLVVGDVGDRAKVIEVCKAHSVDVAVHFAAFGYVEESISKPSLYYRNNLVNGLYFLDALREASVRSVVFSSSCATYGVPPTSARISEELHQRPINPYGFTKLAFERALDDYEAAYGLRSICLRYFNAAGASTKHCLYEAHHPETHFIPRALAAAYSGEALCVNGRDYPTRDGTCERDYVHVDDLAIAHLSAVRLLRSELPSAKINLGIGRGYTLLEIVAATESATCRKINVEFGPRRHGDPPALIADPARAFNALGWSPKYTQIDAIIATAAEGTQRFLRSKGLAS